ncbi:MULTISPECIES: lipopolysaccharide biosynthesis protein [Methylomicrobium]|uniref:Membrane protein involved in the export of O-antigen and teichoic acid n=1 Tax=Methylomicrobium album BG8 TaxID=686340 RepID=H8GPA4_METAL|nr:MULTISPECIES: lipopolysaccharide biosynthesis protein [Methylomicrobium]EIC29690.1 membrane protein involved in the export of O-antigen and teichoic acid [Methylomicrobium album BG8]
MPSLQNNVSKGILWSAVDVSLRQGSQFAVLIVMARILSPEDFGVMALLALFAGLANVFVDGGFGSALIQRQNVTRTDESTVFFFNLAMGFSALVALCVLAPYLARLFDKPILRPLTYAMAANVFIGAFGAIHTTLLTKELNLKLIARIGGIASAVSGALAIGLALEGFGPWSLALQVVAANAVSTLLLWHWHAWRPLWTFSFSSLRSYFRFGGYLLIVALADLLHTHLYSLLIGKFYQVREVGFYDRAQKTQSLPVNFIMLVINRVAFSAFSTLAEDRERLSRAFRKAQRLVLFVNTPLSILTIVLAEPIVLALFGEKWLPSAPLLQVLGIAGLLWPMHILNTNVLKAQGRSDLFFNIMLVKKSVAIGLTVWGSFYGIIAIAWAQVAASVFALAVNAYYSKIFLNYGVFRQLQDLLPSLTAGALAGAAAWLQSQHSGFSCYADLALGTFLAGLVYLLLARLLDVNTLTEFTGLFKKRSLQH